MGIKVILAIHWHALRLFLKGIRFHSYTEWVSNKYGLKKGLIGKEDKVESKTRLPRWFNGVSVILKNLRRGSLEIILPDKRSFIIKGKKKVQWVKFLLKIMIFF